MEFHIKLHVYLYNSQLYSHIHFFMINSCTLIACTDN